MPRSDVLAAAAAAAASASDNLDIMQDTAESSGDEQDVDPADAALFKQLNPNNPTVSYFHPVPPPIMTTPITAQPPAAAVLLAGRSGGPVGKFRLGSVHNDHRSG